MLEVKESPVKKSIILYIYSICGAEFGSQVCVSAVDEFFTATAVSIQISLASHTTLSSNRSATSPLSLFLSRMV